jgi:hypothetical protein
MKSTRFSITILLFSFLYLWCLASAIFADLPEGLLEEDISFDDILNDIPPDFDFRTASVSEWSALPFFSSTDAEMIVSMRDSLLYDSMDNSILDLPDLSPFQSSILWFIKTRESFTANKTTAGSFRSGYSIRPPNRAGDGKYYFKAGAAAPSGKYHFSILAERDAFEQRALDSYSCFGEFSIDKGRSKIIIGDFRPGYSQGLLFSRYGRSYDSGIDISSPENRNQGNSSFEETMYLRGLLVNSSRGPVSVQFFSSLRRLDATLDENGKVTGIDTSGIHTGGAVSDNLTEMINGGHIAFKWGTINELSVTEAVSQYSPSLLKKTGERYLNNPSGTIFVHTGIAGKFQIEPAVLFFEYALLKNAGSAFIGGIKIKKKNGAASLLYREYGTDYWSRHAGGFSSFGSTSNEKGLYSSAEIKLPLELIFSPSVDIGHLKSRSYSDSLPETRLRACFYLQKKFRKSLTGTIALRSVQDDETNKIRKNYRFSFEKKPDRNSHFGWKTLTAWSESEGVGGPYTAATFTFFGKRSWNIKYSAGLFSIPDYGSRFYISEESVPGQCYTTPVWGRGMISSILIEWFDVSCRYRIMHSNMMKTIQECIVQFDILS